MLKLYILIGKMEIAFHFCWGRKRNVFQLHTFVRFIFNWSSHSGRNEYQSCFISLNDDALDFALWKYEAKELIYIKVKFAMKAWHKETANGFGY